MFVSFCYLRHFCHCNKATKPKENGSLQFSFVARKKCDKKGFDQLFCWRNEQTAHTHMWRWITMTPTTITDTLPRFSGYGFSHWERDNKNVYWQFARIFYFSVFVLFFSSTSSPSSSSSHTVAAARATFLLPPLWSVGLSLSLSLSLRSRFNILRHTFLSHWWHKCTVVEH